MIIAYTYALIAAIFWGIGFIGSRYGLDEVGPIWLTFLRFFIASIVFMPAILKIKKESFNFSLLKGAFISAIFLSLVIILQISGLQYTTVAKSGFITILYAFFVPLISYFVFKRSIAKNFWILLSGAFFGMILISEFEIKNLNYGDFLTLLCALSSACHIISISKFSKGKDLRVFNLIQLFFVSLICLPTALILEGVPESLINLSILDNHKAVGGIIFMGIFSTSIAFFMQAKSQQKIPAHIAGLIFLLESPLAAMLGFLAFNEEMTYIAMIGCLLVISCVALMPFENMNLRPLKVHLIKFANIFGMLAITILILNSL